MKSSHYQLKHFSSNFLWVGDIGASRASKYFKVNPDNEENTIEINVNININGTNADIASPRNLGKYDLYLYFYFFIFNKYLW